MDEKTGKVKTDDDRRVSFYFGFFPFPAYHLIIFFPLFFLSLYSSHDPLWLAD